MSPTCTDEQKKKGCVTIINNGDVIGCYENDQETKCQTGGAPKISNKYKIKYLNSKNKYQKGGAPSSGNTKSKDSINWSNEQSQIKYDYLITKSRLGKPTKVCKNSNDIVEYVVWQDPYDAVSFGRYGGLDYLKLSNHHAQKYHPYPAPVFIIAGKYMRIPDKLLGPIKYASETINIEQLFVEKSSNDRYRADGTKDLALVTGSCASINISTITVAFVEDMVSKYESSDKSRDKLDTIFRNEYDARIARYIDSKTKGQYKQISWYDPDFFGEAPSTL